MSDLSPLDRMKEVAAKETAAARLVWRGRAPGFGMDDPGPASIHRLPINSVAARLEPLLGKGYTAEQAAERLGCHINSIRSVLAKKGWTL